MLIAWEDYDQWNSVLARRLFSPEFAGLPVYVDVDKDLLSAICKDLGVITDDPCQELIDVVRPTLGIENRKPLVSHVLRHRVWRESLTLRSRNRTKSVEVDPPAPPPTLALLATLVLAAEKMGEDSRLSSQAYYKPLGMLFGLDDDEVKSLRKVFPKTETFWRGINEYLEVCEGAFGLPTAYALGHRYVGIPQSQSVIRAADRKRLPDFFAQFGLLPGAEMVSSDIEALFNSWVQQNPSPVTQHLQNMWKSEKSRDRIAQVVSIELSLWDGNRPEGSGVSGNNRSSLSIAALVQQGFGTKRIDFSFLARFAHPGDIEELEVSTALDKPRIGVSEVAGSRVAPLPGSHLDSASLLGAVVELTDPKTGASVRRQPRAVVPFRRDDLTGNLVEVEQIQLFDDSVLLVKDDERIVQSVTELLEAFGRFDSVHRSDGIEMRISGIPAGWVLIEGVQMLAIPPGVKNLNLNPLVPLSSAQLIFSGGLRLPGRIRKWSSLCPPEIRAVVSEAEELTLALWDLGSGDRTLLEQWTDSVSAMAVSLNELALEDGDYEVSLSTNSSGERVIASSTLRLRSSDLPDLASWEQSPRLNYELDNDFLVGLSASEISGKSENWIDGLSATVSIEAQIDPLPISEGITWSTSVASRSEKSEPVVLGFADPKSCVATGAHRLIYPTWHGERASIYLTIEGECVMCGLRKISPTKPPKKKIRLSGAPTNEKLEFKVTKSASVGEIDIDSCVDALVHIGGGNIYSFERVMVQAQSESYTMNDFVTRMETIGHLDIERDSSLAPIRWEANPAFLGETMKNGFLLAGVWSRIGRKILKNAIEPLGGLLVDVKDESGLTIWFVRGLDGDGLESAVLESDLTASVIWDASSAMLSALPPLSAVAESMPVVPIPFFSKAEVFDTSAAQWRPTSGVGAPGAYRIEQSFRSKYLWIDETGARERTCRIGTAQLVKHLAARSVGRPLLGYLPGESKLLVPVGSELPGVYGRAAVLCSGLSPAVSPKTRTIAYHDVPPDFANTLNALLLN